MSINIAWTVTGTVTGTVNTKDAETGQPVALPNVVTRVDFTVQATRDDGGVGVHSDAITIGAPLTTAEAVLANAGGAALLDAAKKALGGGVDRCEQSAIARIGADEEVTDGE